MSPRARSVLVSGLMLAVLLPVPARAFFDLGGFDFGSFDLGSFDVGGMTSGLVDTATGGQAFGRLFENAIPLLGVGLVVGGIVQGLEGGGGGGGGTESISTTQFGQTDLVGGTNNPYLGPLIAKLEKQARLEQASTQTRTQIQPSVPTGPQNDPYAGLPVYGSAQNTVTSPSSPSYLPPNIKPNDSAFFSYTPAALPLPMDAREKPIESAVEKVVPAKQLPSAGTQAVVVTPNRTVSRDAPIVEGVRPAAPVRTSTEAPAPQTSSAPGDGSLRIAYGTDVLVLPRAQLEEDAAAKVTEEAPSTKEPGTVSRTIQKTAIYFGQIIGSVLDGIAGTKSNDADTTEQPLNTSQSPSIEEQNAEIARAVAAIMQSAPPMEPALHAECTRLVAAMMIVYEFDSRSIDAGEYAAAQALVRAYEAGEYAFLSEECKAALEKTRTHPEIWKMGDAGTASQSLETAILERTAVELTAEKTAATEPVLIPTPNTVTECVGATCVKRGSEVPFPSAEGTVRRGINGLYAWFAGLFGAAKKNPEPIPPPAPKPFEPTVPEKLSECQDIARSRWMLRFAQDGATIPNAVLAQHRARLATLPQEKISECVLSENVCEAAVFNLILLREVTEGRLSFPGEGQEHFKANLEDANKFLTAECRRNSSNPPKAKIWGLRPVGGY